MQDAVMTGRARRDRGEGDERPEETGPRLGDRSVPVPGNAEVSGQIATGDRAVQQAVQAADQATANTISGGTQLGPVIQARDINGPVAFQLPAVVPSGVNGLRAPAAEFVGRDQVLAELLALIDPGAAGTRAARVSAVAGLGGVGKTELAVQAAHQALARGWFPGGVLAINLHGYETDRRLDTGTALARLLRRLQVPEEVIPAEDEERGELYRAVLHAYADQGRPVLVVVDNASPAAPPDELLPGVGPAIVTSRHTLDRLGGRLLDLNVLPPQRAMELLSRLLRLKLGAPDPRLTDQTEDAERLVEWCAGLPLAIEIVAALLVTRPRKSLAATLSRLEAGRARAGEVNAVFALSYEALEPVQQRVFRLMALNPGPQISTPAVAALTGLSEEHAEETLEVLAAAHLVQEAEQDGRHGWWRTHDLVTAYATTLIDHATGHDADQALERLLRYYNDTARAATALLGAQGTNPATCGFATRAAALQWLDAEFPNLAAAAHTAAGPHPDIAIDLSLNLAPYLDWRRRFADWITLTALARDTARRTGDRRGEGQALVNLGSVLREVRRFEEAVDVLQQADAICRETGAWQDGRAALNNLGVALRQAGRIAEAVAAHRQDLAVWRESGDRHGEGRALNNLGLALLEAERFEEAVTVLQQAASVMGETGDRYGEGATLGNLGLALRPMGRVEEAVTAHQQNLAACCEAGDRHGEGRASTNLGIALVETGRFEEAVAAHRQAVAVFGETGDRHGEGKALNNLGLALAETEHFEEAITVLQRAATVMGETGDPHGEALALLGLGRIWRQIDQTSRAAAAFTDAAALFQQAGDEAWHHQALANLRTVQDG
ncbi:tetratricopeptide repeat protein [Spirillospora sp. NPDC050679]